MAMKTVVRRMVVPASAFRLDSRRGTAATRGKGGLFTGRRLAPKKADKTVPIRVTRFVDVNKNKKQDSADLYPGQIIGRTSLKTKPSKVTIARHYRTGKVVRSHFRRV